MPGEKLKIVVIGTGNLAGIAVRSLQGRDEIELVGVWGRSRNIGIDAGLLDSDVACSVIITSDIGEILAMKPDCAIMAINERDGVKAQQINGDWFVKLLEAGINVVTASDGGLVYPPAHVDQAYVARLEAAAKKGGVTLYMNGQEPGFVEHMALLCATLSNTIKRITSYELFNYSSIKARDEMSLNFGFDEPMEFEGFLERPGYQMAVWGNPITHVVEALGYKVDRYEELYEKRVTDKRIKVGWGFIEPGKVAAVRIRTSAYVEGREAVVVEHVNRMDPDLAPDWEQADTVGCMRIRIEGDPNAVMECNIGDPHKPEELAYDGYLMTAMRIVNAIPVVCAAPPGLTTFRDLPLTLPSSAFRSDATVIDHKIMQANT